MMDGGYNSRWLTGSEKPSKSKLLERSDSNSQAQSVNVVPKTCMSTQRQRKPKATTVRRRR
jgi:hypothetical protein